MTKLSYLEAIRQAHDLALEKNKNTFILGEDVGKRVAYLALHKAYKKNMEKNV